MNPTKRAPARATTAALNPEADRLTKYKLAAAALQGLVITMRDGLKFDDGYIVATLLAGANSIIADLPGREAWADHLNKMARDARAANGR
jgi:hypothetical protein